MKQEIDLSSLENLMDSYLGSRKDDDINKIIDHVIIRANGGLDENYMPEDEWLSHDVNIIWGFIIVSWGNYYGISPRYGWMEKITAEDLEDFFLAYRIVNGLF